MEEIKLWCSALFVEHKEVIMGCDIHIGTETYNKFINKWESADDWELEVEEDGEWYRPIRSIVDLHSDYFLFGLLAGVRGNHILWKQKGWPNDMSPQMKKYRTEWGGDAHSSSFLTLQELLSKMTGPSSRKEAIAQEALGVLPLLSIKSGIVRENISGEKQEFPEFAQLIRALKKIQKSEGVLRSEVRIVFFFDN